MHVEIGPLEINLKARFRDAERERELVREANKQNWVGLLSGGVAALVPTMIDYVMKKREEMDGPWPDPPVPWPEQPAEPQSVPPASGAREVPPADDGA